MIQRYNHKDSHKNRFMRWLFIVASILFLIGMLGFLCGCHSTRPMADVVEVKREVMRTDTLRLHTHSVDTVVERDSVYVWQRGDTLTKEVTRWRYKVHMLTDTLWRAKVDSVYVEKPVTITVERKLTKWESVKQHYGGWALAFICLLVLGAGAWAVIKYKIRA